MAVLTIMVRHGLSGEEEEEADCGDEVDTDKGGNSDEEVETGEDSEVACESGLAEA